MDIKHKALLLHHKPFMTKNIIWSPQLASKLRSQGLLTDSMLQDIEACQTREEKIRLLIDVLPLKDTHGFNKFLDILQTSGHTFIADFLREDEDSQKVFDVNDMYRHLSFVHRAFNEAERKQIETYMSERVESQVLKLMWKRADKEKDKALEAIEQQVEQAYEYEVKEKKASEIIQKLENEIATRIGEKAEMTAKMAALTAAYREMEQKHKESLEIQMRYNQANDNAAQRATERLAGQEKLLSSIKSKLRACVKVNTKSDGIYLDEDEKDENEQGDTWKTQGEFFYLLEDIDLFTRKFKNLLEIRRHYEDLLKERDSILEEFGYSKDRQAEGLTAPEPRLIDAYHSFMLKNEETSARLKQDLKKYAELLEEKKAKLENLTREKEEQNRKAALASSIWQNAIMNIMRKQLQDLKADNRKKISVMAFQEAEMLKMRNKITELERQVNHTERNLSQKKITGTHLDNDASSVTFENANLTPLETRNPSKSEHLPLLKSTNYQLKMSTSPRQSLVKHRAPQAVTQSHYMLKEPASSQFPIGPITKQMKPGVRGNRPSQMASILGNLKTMNKHLANRDLQD